MKLNRKWLNNKWGPLTVAACTAVILYLCLSHINLLFVGIGKLLNFFKPVIVGLILAYVINPFAGLYERYVLKKMKKRGAAHIIAVILAIVSLVALIVILFVMLIPQLIASVRTLISNLGIYLDGQQEFMNSIIKAAADHGIDASGILDLKDKIVPALQKLLPSDVNTLISTFSNIGSNIFNQVIAFIMAIYFLMDKNHLFNGFKKLMRLILSEKHYRENADFWMHCNKILIRFIGCDLLDGLLVGVVNFIFLTILRYPYAVLIAVICGVTNLIPTFGPIVGGAVGAFILVLIKPMYALVFLIFTVILQTMDGYVIKPKLFGESFGVSSVWILICIIVGGRIFNVWGVLLGIPFAAISDYIYHEYILKSLRARRERLDRAEAEKTAAESAEISDPPSAAPEVSPEGTAAAVAKEK